jgi:carbon monoxide dehydrogenase subunit G
MQFTATEEVAAPVDDVWREVTDFDRFEKMIARRGGQVRRQGSGPVGPGTSWTGALEAMGKVRSVEITLERMTVPSRIAALARAEGVDVAISVSLEPLAPERTRMTVVTDAQPRSMGARIVLKPMALAQGRLQERYAGGVAAFARRIEAA